MLAVPVLAPASFEPATGWLTGHDACVFAFFGRAHPTGVQLRLTDAELANLAG